MTGSLKTLFHHHNHTNEQKANVDNGAPYPVASESYQHESDTFSSLCPPDSPNIVLVYKTSDTNDLEIIVSPVGQTIYRVDMKKGEVRRETDHFLVGSWTEHLWHSERLKFVFAHEGGKWGFNPDTHPWTSKVGTLNGHELQWTNFDNHSGTVGRFDDDSQEKRKIAFSMRCADSTDPDRRIVCTITANSWHNATFTIPRDIIQDPSQLDEMMVVTIAVMSRVRGGIKSQMDSDQSNQGFNNQDMNMMLAVDVMAADGI